jgi:hypothetical protein
VSSLRGRWAQGLEPRNFTWIMRDRLAAAERPGGFSRNHRKVRRHEELIWLRQQGFTRIVSLLDSSHNLHAYEEAGLVGEHLPLGRSDELADHLQVIYTRIAGWLDTPDEKLFVHHEEFGDRLLGFLGGYLIFSGLVPEGPNAIAVIEKLGTRTLGAEGREIIATVLTHEIRRPPSA